MTQANIKFPRDYSQSVSPRFDAVEDVKEFLGKDWDGVSADMAKVASPSRFVFWAEVLGVRDSFAIQVWWELYHGQGSWAKALGEELAR
jgi:hypothetical protein